MATVKNIMKNPQRVGDVILQPGETLKVTEKQKKDNPRIDQAIKTGTLEHVKTNGLQNSVS